MQPSLAHRCCWSDFSHNKDGSWCVLGIMLCSSWMKGCSDLLNNTKHTLSLLKQDSASHTTSTAMGPIQADHCRSVPTLQVLLLTTATAEQCSRLALTAAANLTWLEILYLDRGATPFYPQGGDLLDHAQPRDISALLTCLWEAPRKPCHGAFPVTHTAFSTSHAAKD